jgi:hypothetical protein
MNTDNSNLWNIDYNIYEEQLIDCIKNYKQGLNLLNVENTTFDVIEKVVYEIAMFHFQRLNINFNPNENFVEFWFKRHIANNNEKTPYNINQFHYDCDEVEKIKKNNHIHPVLSCTAYFNDNDFPLLLSEIKLEEYKFKKFENKNSLKLIFPKKNTHFSFDGSNYHGVVDVFNKLNNSNEKFVRYMLAINLWNKRPTNIPYYKAIVHLQLQNQNNNNENRVKRTFSKEEQITTITESKFQIKELELDTETNVLDFNFYEQMLYTPRKFVVPNEISQLVKNEMEKNEYYGFKITYKGPQKPLSLTEKSTNFTKLIKDVTVINSVENNTNTTEFTSLDFLYNRFIQRFNYNKIFSKNVCEWIIFESEEYAKNNGGWTTKRHEKYPTMDLPLEKIKNIFNFVLFSFSDIFNKIKKSYYLPDDVSFNIKDLFVVKYDEQMQNSLELHNDGSFLSINILLSDPKDFEGGGTYFNDGLTVFLEQGDLLVHSGKVKHAGLPVTKGTRYIMVAFVIIDVKLNNV